MLQQKRALILVAALAVSAAACAGRGRSKSDTPYRPPPPKTCRDNLKQLGTALLMYLQDWNERLPPASRWADALKPYVRHEAVWHCPQDRRPGRPSYAMNRELAGKSLKDSHNWHRVLLFESDAAARNRVEGARAVCSPGRHKGGNNYLLMDGRIQWRKEAPEF